jgi:hypothetical protein
MFVLPFMINESEKEKLDDTGLQNAFKSPVFTTSVVSAVISTTPMLIDLAMDGHKMFLTKTFDECFTGRVCYVVPILFISLQLMLSNYNNFYTFAYTSRFRYFLCCMWLYRIISTHALMYLLRTSNPEVFSNRTTLFASVVTGIAAIYRVANVSTTGTPSKSFLTAEVITNVPRAIFLSIVIHWVIGLYRWRDHWRMKDYASILFLLVVCIVWYLSLIVQYFIPATGQNFLINMSPESLAIVFYQMTVSTILCGVIPGRIARLEVAAAKVCLSFCFCVAALYSLLCLPFSPTGCSD